MTETLLHGGEPHTARADARSGALRAAVLGANDGIVSVAALVVGVAGATADRGTVLTAGVAGLVAGAVSMAVGEYVSVSSQRDRELALLAKERRELAEEPERELAELAGIYRAKGLSRETADRVAAELTAADAFAAHVEAELGLDPDERADPRVAAASSAAAFTAGALLPLLAVLLSTVAWRVPVVVVAVLVALALTGTLSARVSGAPVRRAVLRVLVGGAAGLALTYGIGAALGTVVA